jgi:tRNA threonylcarbamoyladenosine modification (KEOPS) complex  Pcc1 subunit
MGEVVRFIPKAERERIRLIREARALYDSVFPPSNSVNEQRGKTAMTRSVNGARVHHGDEVLS